MQFPNEIFHHILSFLSDSEVGKFDLPDSFWRKRARKQLRISRSIFNRQGKFQLTCKQRYFQLFFQRNFLENVADCEMNLEEEILIAAKYGTVEQISSLFSVENCKIKIPKEIRILCHKTLLERNPPRTDVYLRSLPKWLAEEVGSLYEGINYRSAIFRQWNPQSYLDTSSNCHLYWRAIFSEDPQVCEKICQYLSKHLKEDCLDVSLAYIFSYLLSSSNEIYHPFLEKFFSDHRTIEERIQHSKSFFELLLSDQSRGRFKPSKKIIREWISYLADSSLRSHDKARISFFLHQGIQITLNGILQFIRSPSPKKSVMKFEILETFSPYIEQILQGSQSDSELLFKICFESLRNFDFDSLDFFLSKIQIEKRSLIISRLLNQSQNRLMRNYLASQL